MSVRPLAELRAKLVQLGRDFLCDTPLPAAAAQVRFIGPFMGEDVVWDMTLTTLAAVRRDGPAPCPFIAITPARDGVHAITVGLDISHIDEPSILKSMVMVRKYKRLAIGRLDFCA